MIHPAYVAKDPAGSKIQIWEFFLKKNGNFGKKTRWLESYPKSDGF
jgi:hypothetical protein